jgi:hypothetical protein
MPTPRIGRTARRVRAAVARRARRLADRLDGRLSLALDYPTSAENRPRYGFGRPAHPGLAEIISSHAGDYRAALEMILRYQEALGSIPPSSGGALEPAWRNPYLPALDGAAIYAFLRDRRPRRYLEIGSGHSTRFAARAKHDGGLATQIVSIDPFPRAQVEALVDTAIRHPLETADLAVFDPLESGDVVFMDGSHRVFMNSDATVFFLDVLLALPPGVLVGIHDIYLPDDYDPWEIQDFYSEQYLLAMALLTGAARLRPVLPAHYVGRHPELRRILDPLWNEPNLAGADHSGNTFWLEIPVAPA